MTTDERPAVAPVAVTAVLGFCAVVVGGAVLGTGARALLGLVVPCVLLLVGLLWAISGPPPRRDQSETADRRGTDLLVIAVGAVAGVLVIAVGAFAAGAAATTVALLLPLAVLGGGVLWAFHGQPAATPAASVSEGGAGDGWSVPPTTTPSSGPLGADLPGAVDVPTILAAPEMPEGETVSEAVRLDAARAFDLGPFLLDEPPDRIQCSNCGRYTHLVPAGEHGVTCEICGTTRRVAKVQPDTRVRMFLDDGPDDGPEPKPEPEVDAPTVVTTTTSFAPPSSHRGG